METSRHDILCFDHFTERPLTLLCDHPIFPHGLCAAHAPSSERAPRKKATRRLIDRIRYNFLSETSFSRTFLLLLDHEYWPIALFVFHFAESRVSHFRRSRFSKLKKLQGFPQAQENTNS